MAPKKPSQPRDRAGPPPNPKGKGRAKTPDNVENQDPPGSPSTSQPRFTEMPSSNLDLRDQPGFTTEKWDPKNKRAPEHSTTKAGLRSNRRDDDASDSWMSDDSIMKDMAGHPQSELINHFTNLPRPANTAGTGVHAAQPSGGTSTADTSPFPSSVLNLREDASTSTSSLLQPPTRDDHSSSASSRGSKRRRGPSPQPSRASRRPSTRARHESPPQHSLATEQQIAMLREQVRLQQAEVDTINRQMRNAYDAGFAQGQSAGYQAAMNSMLAGGNRPNPRESRMAEEDEADDLRRALDESRLNPRPSRPTQNPGAGPSRSSERPAQNRNEGARTRGPNPNMPIVTTSGDYREYEFTSVRRGGVEYPHERYPGLTSLPFPVAEMTFPRRGVAVVRVPRTIPSVEESTTYSDLWANFADGRTVPDPIRRLSRALGASFSEFEARDAVLGYGLVRRINAALHGVLDRDAVHAFLVTLAAFDRTLRLTEGSDSLWSRLLQRHRNLPLGVWTEIRAYQHPEIYPRNDFGITFTPPSNPNNPWGITTLWQRDEFMQILLAVRPSLVDLRRLLTYTDVFLRTRTARRPLPGTYLNAENPEQTYTASFIRGPGTPHAFIEGPVATGPQAHADEMEVEHDLPRNTPSRPT